MLERLLSYAILALLAAGRVESAWWIDSYECSTRADMDKDGMADVAAIALTPPGDLGSRQ